MMTSFYGMKAVVAACLVLAFAIVHVDAYRAQQDYINTKYAHCPRPARALPAPCPRQQTHTTSTYSKISWVHRY